MQNEVDIKKEEDKFVKLEYKDKANKAKHFKVLLIFNRNAPDVSSKKIFWVTGTQNTTQKNLSFPLFFF